MTSRRRRQRGSRLFALYVLASLVPISVIGAVAVHGDTKAGAEFGRDWGRAQSAVIEQMVIAPALRGADLTLGLDAAERGRLQSATDLAIFNGTVSHLRLRSLRGTVAFSDDGSVAGSVPVTDPAFRAAAAGGTDVRVIETTPHSSGLVRVMQPVIAAANGQTTGVLEVYLPYDAIATKVQAETHSEITRLALSLIGLFALLALISWWTTRALRNNAATHEYESLHDSLTGLPNRELFRRTAEDALERGRRGEQGAMVLIDLDHFKEVNDTIGHHAGDELLRIVARRLRGSLRTDDIVARLGGDEFAMVLPRGGGQQETLALLYRIREELAEEVVLDGVSLSVAASFGVCFYPQSAETVEDLLQHADAAMYRGKQGQLNQGGIVIYEAAMAHHPTHALLIQRELRGALDRDELVLHYQPKVTLSSGRVTCLEALVRWQHPARGLLLPSEFLSAAESCEVIEPLTSWVLRRALTDYTAWTAAGHDWMVAVNVSARNLRSPEFAGSVARILLEANVPPPRLHLEVSETALAFDVELARTAIGPLIEQGISVALDHFGMDRTDLAQLLNAGVSEIKMDRTFLADLPGNERDRATVRSVITLGHALGCRVTAQGVESREVAEVLEDAGCDDAQGYLWLHPGPWSGVARAFGTAEKPADTAVTPSQTTRGGLRTSR
jgi:diguanylate cyclase (GGDEF)-like protein